MWQDTTDICLLVPLWGRLLSGKGGDCAFPDIAQVNKLMEVQDKKGEREGGGRKDKTEQKLQKVLRKAGNRTALQVSEGKERKYSLALGRGRYVTLCKPAELLD